MMELFFNYKIEFDEMIENAVHILAATVKRKNCGCKKSLCQNLDGAKKMAQKLMKTSIEHAN